MAAESRLSAVVGSSQRLRDAALARLRAGWDGPVARQIAPADPAGMLLALATPSLFGERTLTLLRCDEAWVARHRDLLLPHVGAEPISGRMILVLDALDGREALAKALAAAGACHRCEGPGKEAELPGWIAMQCSAHPQGVADLHRLAEVLARRIGNDPDAILGAIDQIALASHPGQLRAEDAEALLGGEAARPAWEFSGALVEGRTGEALRLLHAPASGEPPQLLAALCGELRKLIACHEHRDDAEVVRVSGIRGVGGLSYARRRAARLPRATLLRLLKGALDCARASRSGRDPLVALEQYVAQAGQVVRGAARG